MSVEWLQESVRSISMVCLLIAMIECAADAASDDGFHLICGAVVALSVVRMAAAALSLSG